MYRPLNSVTSFHGSCFIPDLSSSSSRLQTIPLFEAYRLGTAILGMIWTVVGHHYDFEFMLWPGLEAHLPPCKASMLTTPLMVPSAPPEYREYQAVYQKLCCREVARAANLAKPISGVIFDLIRSARGGHNFMTFSAMYLEIKCK